MKKLNQILNDLKLSKHPDKTFIGRIEKGFDFLGYRFSRGDIGLAEKTLHHLLNQWQRLYEQKKTAPESAANLGSWFWVWMY